MKNIVGNNISRRRKELGLTQEELALRMGYKSKSTINKIELGVNDIPQSKIMKFADVLNTTPLYLLGWDAEPEETKKKIDTATDVLIRMEKDVVFSELVNKLYKLDDNKIKAVSDLLDSFLE